MVIHIVILYTQETSEASEPKNTKNYHQFCKMDWILVIYKFNYVTFLIVSRNYEASKVLISCS